MFKGFDMKAVTTYCILQTLAAGSKTIKSADTIFQGFLPDWR